MAVNTETPLVIVENKLPRAVIVIGGEAREGERSAASELQGYVREATGAGAVRAECASRT